MSEGHNPLTQFEVNPIISMQPLAGHNVDFTNASAWMVLAIISAFLFFTLGMRGRALVPGRWQSMVELTYEFVADMVKDTVGNEGKQYFPFIFSLFIFILFCNLLGLIPMAFTVTSHIIVAFALAMVVFLGITIIGIARHGFGFLRLFMPDGVPILLAPIIIPIEVVSYLSRPISLSVRLSANMMAGHILLKVVAGFVGVMGLFGFVPMLVLIGFTGFEFFVALLQAYIFTMLTCVYLNDAIHLH